MSISAAFLWRFLDDVWDLLPTEDRRLFETYWSAQVQLAGNLQQKTFEAALSTNVATVPIYLAERWNRFVMDETSCDLFEETVEVVLTGVLASALARDTVFFDTFSVSNANRQIRHQQLVLFYDDSPRALRYGKILKNTVSVRIGSTEYTENRDYAVNYVEGYIRALDGTRLPITDSATVTYDHEEYTRDLDYTVNETASTMTRLADGVISDGAAVSASYTYNTTPTLQMTGSGASLTLTELTDLTKDFTTLLPGRTLTILAGPNAGTYPINVVTAANTFQISGNFVSIQSGEVRYSINAFPHGLRVGRQVASVPVLQNKVDVPSSVMIEGIDHIVGSGILASRTAFGMSSLGPTETRTRAMWAEKALIDAETPYRNFGVLIDFYRTNSEAYRLALQGLWYTFWTGSTPGNLQRGLQILLGLPYARNAGTVSALSLTEIQITDPRGQVLVYAIPSGLTATVALAEEVARFASLTTGVRIIDRNNEPGFVATRLGLSGISRYLTDTATIAQGSPEETRAFALLEHHLFLPQVLTQALTSRISVSELVTFLDNMKPKWTDYVFSFNEDADDTIYCSEDAESDWAIDLTTTVGNNEQNQAFARNNFIISRTTGEIIAGGTMAAGNFRDASADFATAGIDRNDMVMITEGAYKGYHRVLTRISATVLALEIPDALIVGTLDLDYTVMQEEFVLGHDAVQIKRDHILIPGTAYTAPAVLNTKTNAVFGDLENAEVKALLLVDVGNVGNEVQVITDANVALGEIAVGVSPGVVVRDHEISSAAIKRRDNIGAVVTDAFGI